MCRANCPISRQLLQGLSELFYNCFGLQTQILAELFHCNHLVRWLLKVVFNLLDKISAIPVASAPGGATHFKIVSPGAEIDFENETFIMDSSASAVLPWDTTATFSIDHGSMKRKRSRRTRLSFSIHMETSGIHQPAILLQGHKESH